MDSFEFDNVKAKKEDALWRFNMEKKLRSGLRFIGFLLVLFLLSWYWFPTLFPDIAEVAGDLRRRFIFSLNQPLFIFIVINIIILVVYVLSCQEETQKQSTSSDIYHEYVSSRRSIIPAVATAAEATTVDKQIDPVENAVAVTETKRSLSPLKLQQPWKSPTVTKTKPVITSTGKVKQKENRRTRSVASESRNQRPLREFSRSETAMIGRELVISSAESPRKSIDEMSSEEFQLIIDSFIAERRKTLMQENTAHYTEGKENCMFIVVEN